MAPTTVNVTSTTKENRKEYVIIQSRRKL